MDDVLIGQSYGQDADTGIVAASLLDTVPGAPDGPIQVYAIPNGYLLQFDARYTFAPNRMEIRAD